MLIIAVGVFFTNVTGISRANPYLAQILNTYETPVSLADSTVPNIT